MIAQVKTPMDKQTVYYDKTYEYRYWDIYRKPLNEDI